MLFLCISTSQLIASCNQGTAYSLEHNVTHLERMISDRHYDGHNSAGVVFSSLNTFDLTGLELPVLSEETSPFEEFEKTVETAQSEQKPQTRPFFNPRETARNSLELLIKESCSTIYKAFTAISKDSTNIPLDKYKKTYSFISNQLKTYGFVSSSFSIRSTDKPSYNWGTSLSTILIPEADLNSIENDTISQDIRNEFKFLIAHQASHIAKNIAQLSQQVLITAIKKQSIHSSKQAIDSIISRVAGEQYVSANAQLSFKQILVKSLLIDKGKQFTTACVINPIDKKASDELKYIVAKYECMADTTIIDRNTILGGISLLKKLGKSIAASTSFESCDKCLSDISGDRLHALEFKLNKQSNSWIAEFEKTKHEFADNNKLVAKL